MDEPSCSKCRFHDLCSIRRALFVKINEHIVWGSIINGHELVASLYTLLSKHCRVFINREE